MVPVWKSDRFARNRYNGARYKNFRIKNEVKIIPARENISERSKEIILETMLEGYNVLKHNKGQRRSRRWPLLLPCPGHFFRGHGYCRADGSICPPLFGAAKYAISGACPSNQIDRRSLRKVSVTVPSRASNGPE